MTRFLYAVVLGVTLVVPTPASAQEARDVTFSERAVVEVHTKLRFTTLIILPQEERILDYVCGDKDYWVISGADNLAYVKPAKAGASTNLNLVTATGRIYSFLLTEGGEPDLKVYVRVEPVETSALPPPRLASIHELDAARAITEEVRRELESVRKASETTVREAVSKARSAYPLQLRFPYRFRANESPFSVSAVFHDGVFTYIHAHGRELPALYELRDGAASLVPFQVEQGVYIVPHVVERGYLSLGKRRWFFALEADR
jgi:type IV secretion system protein VirB9